MSEFKFACPRCRQHIKSDSSASGTQIECPTCFQKIVVPQAPADNSTKFILAAGQAPGKRPVTESAAPPSAATAPPKSLPLTWAALAAVVVVGAALLVIKLGLLPTRARHSSPHGTNTAPITPGADAADPRWRLELRDVAISGEPARGRIWGREFRLERATIQDGTLALRQGPTWPPDVGVTILLPKRPALDYAGKQFLIETNFAGKSPRVVLRIKDQSQQPLTHSLNGGYAMKLEFGEITDRALPGRIYLCTPDDARSVVVGSFCAEIRKPNPPKPKAPRPAPRPKTP